MYEVAKERDDGSGICYPPTLPNDRGNTAQICGIGFICVLLSVVGGTVYCKEGMIETAVYVVLGPAVGIVIIGLLHLVWRICFLAEELHHIPGRYPDKKSAAWEACMFNKESQYALSISFIIMLFIWVHVQDLYTYLCAKGPVASSMSFLASLCISWLLHMEESNLHMSLHIVKTNNLYYGSGMAFNYFYGYLRLVLPDPEVGTTSVKGIKKRIETFINYHHLSDSAFPVKKLFILIPKSLYTPTDLREVSTDWPDTTNYWMEAAVSLEPQELDRAGVKQRVYKNSVYKIRNRDSPGEEPVYVVAEGATPLKTCYDVIKFDPRMSCVFKDQQHEIVSSFYKTLRDIIRGNDDCRDVCEIIYYVDVDENEKKVNVARIILERIKELTQRNSVQ